MQSLGHGFAFRLVPRGTKRTRYVNIQLGHLWWLRHCISCWPLYSRIKHWKFGILYIFFKRKKKKTLILFSFSRFVSFKDILLRKYNKIFKQGWRACYYGAGIIGLIVAALTFTLSEPERKTIGEEGTSADGKKVPIWKVILQPRIILLCLAASIRHCGKGQYLDAKD